MNEAKALKQVEELLSDPRTDRHMYAAWVERCSQIATNKPTRQKTHFKSKDSYCGRIIGYGNAKMSFAFFSGMPSFDRITITYGKGHIILQNFCKNKRKLLYWKDEKGKMRFGIEPSDPSEDEPKPNAKSSTFRRSVRKE